MSEIRFDAPGPGTWLLDTSHLDQPRCYFTSDVLARRGTEGFRTGFSRYGVLLDTIEFAAVGPYPYMAVRPLGAPPGATGVPPRWLFTLLLKLHPALRRRIATARRVVAGRPWIADAAKFKADLPEAESRIAAFAAVPLGALDDAAFADHLTRLIGHLEERLHQHFANVPLVSLPIGDFLAFLVECGIPSADGLTALRGFSPSSVAASRALSEAAAAIAGDAAARTILDEAAPAAAILARLRALVGPAAQAVARLMDCYGDAIITGVDITGLSVVELPELVVGTLRAQVAAADAPAAEQHEPERAAATLRERIPAHRRSDFDDRLADARAVYPLRDAQTTVDAWMGGVVRRVLLEAATRLVASGRLAHDTDIFDASPSEILTLFRGADQSIADAIRVRADQRKRATVAGAPRHLGPAPGEPPPLDWLPSGAGRLARAFAAYRELLDDPAPTRTGAVVRGVAASMGIARGPARLVRSEDDFRRLRKGDILVAPTTTPMYNVILPLLAGIVTDRGGLLSHPAIVSREYGFPGIVGTRDATERIPDGAFVEVNGTEGTVTVLAV